MHIVVMITTANKEEAEKIAQTLVAEKKAACVNILNGVKSVFQWEGKVDTAEECLLIVKTRQALFDELKQRVTELHSYDVPEIIALPVVEGHEPYLNWIDKSTES